MPFHATRSFFFVTLLSFLCVVWYSVHMMTLQRTEDDEREYLKNLDSPLRRKYPTLASMIGCCKGLDTMEEYFARKQADKEKELSQERRYT